jgi:hypothetical protein
MNGCNVCETSLPTDHPSPTCDTCHVIALESQPFEDLSRDEIGGYPVPGYWSNY